MIDRVMRDLLLSAALDDEAELIEVLHDCLPRCGNSLL